MLGNCMINCGIAGENLWNALCFKIVDKNNLHAKLKITAVYVLFRLIDCSFD